MVHHTPADFYLAYGVAIFFSLCGTGAVWLFRHRARNLALLAVAGPFAGNACVWTQNNQLSPADRWPFLLVLALNLLLFLPPMMLAVKFTPPLRPTAGKG